MAGGDGNGGVVGGRVGLHQEGDELGRRIWVGVHELLAQHRKTVLRILDLPICGCSFGGRPSLLFSIQKKVTKACRKNKEAMGFVFFVIYFSLISSPLEENRIRRDKSQLPSTCVGFCACSLEQ